MIVKLRTNIGRQECSIEPPLLAGQERDVGDQFGASLVKRRLAVDVTPEPPLKILRAIPDPPAIAESKAPEIMPTEQPKPKRTFTKPAVLPVKNDKE